MKSILGKSRVVYGRFMLKIDVTQVMTEYNGKPIEQPKGKLASDSPYLTLRDVICMAISAPDQASAAKDWKEAQKRNDLVRKIYLSEQFVELKSDEVVLIKEAIIKAWPSPVVSGEACKMIEPEKAE